MMLWALYVVFVTLIYMSIGDLFGALVFAIFPLFLFWLRMACPSDHLSGQARPRFQALPTSNARRADRACAPCRPLAAGG